VIVVDTNVVARLVLPGQDAALAEEVHRRDPEWVAPPLLYSEIRDVLVMMIRRRDLRREQAIRAATRAVEVMKGDQVPVATPDVLELAERSGCTAYDCEFIAVARLLGVKLVTSDRQVLSAFRETAISPEAFVAH
jgi:predicted nucleic acid-binding protein